MKFFKFIGKILMALAIIIIIALIVVSVYPSFGAFLNKDKTKDYAKRNKYFYDNKFHNIDETTTMTKQGHSNNLLSKKATKPIDEVPVEKPNYEIDSDLTFTWYGHSSLLLQIENNNIMFDPVFSDVSGPFTFAGIYRYSPLPDISDIPKIDFMIITHNHYDHLDYQTIKKLDEKVTRYIVPLGVEEDLIKFGINKEKIDVLSWWEDIKVSNLLITSTPSRHFSGRKLIDSNQTLWSSFIIKGDKYQVFACGDSGFGSHFDEIREKFGQFDLAFMEAGQYNERWSNIHMFPEETYEAASIIKTKYLVPIHWGAFVLSNHAWDDSVERLSLIAEEKKYEPLLITPKLGETVNYDKIEDCQERWWKEIK